LGDKNGETTLHIPVYRGITLHGLATTKKENFSSYFSKEAIGTSFNPDKFNILSLVVKSAKLDDFRLKPSLIKIDVEGG